MSDPGILANPDQTENGPSENRLVEDGDGQRHDGGAGKSDDVDIGVGHWAAALSAAIRSNSAIAWAIDAR